MGSKQKKLQWATTGVFLFFSKYHLYFLKKAGCVEILNCTCLPAGGYAEENTAVDNTVHISII